MAIDLDRNIRRKMALHPNIYFRRKTYWFRRVIRYVLRKLDNRDLELGQSFSPRWNSFKDHAEQLQRDGFVFVENFLNDSDAEILRQNWPGSRYFVPISPNEDHKTSDKGHVVMLESHYLTQRNHHICGNCFGCFLMNHLQAKSALCALTV